MSTLEQQEAQHEAEQVELESIELEHHLQLGEALLRLEKNPDFQEVIMKGYLRDKVLASVSLLATPGIKERGERPNTFEDIISASNLQYFLQMIHSFHEGALNTIKEVEEEMEAENMDPEDLN